MGTSSSFPSYVPLRTDTVECEEPKLVWRRSVSKYEQFGPVYVLLKEWEEERMAIKVVQPTVVIHTLGVFLISLKCAMTISVKNDRPTSYKK